METRKSQANTIEGLASCPFKLIQINQCCCCCCCCANNKHLFMPEHTQDLAKQGPMPESSQHHSSLGHDSEQGGPQVRSVGTIHKWRHVHMTENWRCHARMFYALCTCVTNSQTPSPLFAWRHLWMVSWMNLQRVKLFCLRVQTYHMFWDVAFF